MKRSEKRPFDLRVRIVAQRTGRPTYRWWWRGALIGLATLVLCSCQTTLPTGSPSPSPAPDGSGVGIEVHPAVALRLEAALYPQNESAAECVVPAAAVPLDARAYPFEYLCDGGDGIYPAVVDRQAQLRGLELEDTLVQFADRQGKVQIEPSNRICIYAPRFAAVRRVTRVHEGDEYMTAAAAAAPAQLELAARDLPPLGFIQPQRVMGRAHAEIATPFSDHQRGAELALRHPIVELAYDYQPHEDFQVVRIGIFEAAEKLAMTEFLDAVTTWTINQTAQVIVEDQSAYEMTLDREVGTVYAFRDPQGPRLRLIKLASRAAAQPGDVVDFTIRFDNLGHTEAKDVVIVDNLTTRLEYVPQSAQCTHEAEFSTAENAGESLALTWRLSQPIPAGQGGVIRFQCRVR